MGTSRKIAHTLILLIVLSGALGYAVRPAQARVICEYHHVVKQGEGLLSIARHYGVSLKLIAKVNGLYTDPIILKPRQVLCIPRSNYNPYGPWMQVLEVARNESVTVKGFNFPLEKTLEVHLGYHGSEGLYGWEMYTVKTDSDGKVKVTVEIPPELVGADQIDVRLMTADGGTYAYRWFHNIDSDPSYGYNRDPKLSIVQVSPSDTVTIMTHNFPPNTTFNVFMGPQRNPWVGGYAVGALVTREGGSMQITLAIPIAMWGSEEIAIRIENEWEGYYIYKQFNNTMP